MSNTAINRALAAMQVAKDQTREQNTKPNSESPVSKTELKPAFLNSQLATKAEKTGEPSIDKSSTDSSAEKGLEKAGLDKASLDALINPKAEEKPSKAPLVRVDLSVAGTPHRISCPEDAVEHLNRTAERLNENLREIRRGVVGKSPSNEELLVLHCLDLYDQISELKKLEQSHHIESERANALLDKLVKDSRAMLSSQGGV